MSLAAIARDNRRQRAAPLDGADQQPDPPSGFEMLTRYIPTETITLYVGAMAAKADIAKLLGRADAVWPIYWTFAILTPVLLFLLMLSRHRTGGSTEPFAVHWWPLFASFLAFLVWAMSVPGHPIALELKALPAFAALFLSVMLSLLDPVLGPKK
jgi:hypothetical protein